MIIWLASYPRSGNTLLRTVLKRCFDLDSYADEAIHVESPIRSDSSLIGHRELPDAWEKFYESATRSGELVLVKTHLPPRDAQPYIYVVRDGRSAIRSYKKYYESFVPDHKASLYQLIAGDDAYGDWSMHYKSWVSRDGARGMTVRFEDLGDVSPGLLAQLAAFIGYRGDIRKWINPFGALSAVEPGFFREGQKTFRQDEEWPALANHFFHFFHSELLARLGYSSAAAPSIPEDWNVFFHWSRELVSRNRELSKACDERLALIHRISHEAERRLEIINAMSGSK